MTQNYVFWLLFCSGLIHRCRCIRFVVYCWLILLSPCLSHSAAASDGENYYRFNLCLFLATSIRRRIFYCNFWNIQVWYVASCRFPYCVTHARYSHYDWWTNIFISEVTIYYLLSYLINQNYILSDFGKSFAFVSKPKSRNLAFLSPRQRRYRCRVESINVHNANHQNKNTSHANTKRDKL